MYGGRFGEYESEFDDRNVQFIDLGDAADLNSDMGGVSVSVCTQYRQYCLMGVVLRLKYSQIVLQCVHKHNVLIL